MLFLGKGGKGGGGVSGDLRKKMGVWGRVRSM